MAALDFQVETRTKELALQNLILDQISQTTPLPLLLDMLVRQIEAAQPDVLASVLLLDQNGKHLRLGAAPSLSPDYNRAIDGLVIGEGVGSCGTAAFRNEIVIVEDIQKHPFWKDYAELAREADLQSCWSYPICGTEGKVLGTLALYHRNPASPAQKEIVQIARYAKLAMLAIERKYAVENLRIAATAFESKIGMIITDANKVVLRVNRSFTEITGYSAQEAIGQTPLLLKSGRHDKGFYNEMWKEIKAKGSWQGEMWDRLKGGEISPVWVSVSAVKDVDDITTHYVATFTDIAERKAAEEQIKKLAFYDALTGLANRVLLQDRVRQIISATARDRSCGALLFIDLDNFKTLNDTLGHETGDKLLQQVAGRLNSCVRTTDTVARLGGDEFVVMLTDLSEDEADAAVTAEVVAEKILQALNEVYLLGSATHKSTASIGIALLTKRTVGIEELMKQADLAMYKSKASGRNQLHFFDPAMQRSVMARVELEKDFRRAIEVGQFVLHYQAQVVGEKQLTGAEVLVRWNHPIRGIVAPGEFIPLAEETGLIISLGQWVLETACAQLARWAVVPGMEHLTVAVNVSAQQFRIPNFTEQVLTAIQDAGANPRRLKLELTESMLATDVEDIISKMSLLQLHGIEFSMDDFGIGYSSLSYLKRLPINQLKIDQSFVRDLLTDSNDAAIARTIMALAQSLGLSVIAEGVETVAQRDFLAALGCTAYQGYLFSKPVPITDFEALIAKNL